MSERLKSEKRRTEHLIKVLDGRVQRKPVSEIAQELGKSDRQVWRYLADLRKMGVDRDVIEQERKVQREVLPLVTARLIAIVLYGKDVISAEVGCRMMKGLGAWKENLELVGKLEPSDMQKRMSENVEKLLKIETTKEVKQETSTYPLCDRCGKRHIPTDPVDLSGICDYSLVGARPPEGMVAIEGNDDLAVVSTATPENGKQEASTDQRGRGTPTTHPASSDLMNPSHNFTVKNENSKEKDEL